MIPVEKLLSWATSAAAVAIAVTVVHREFFGPPPSHAASRRPSEFVREWRTIAKSGRVLGDTNAPVKVIEFMDFQCPFCREFNQARKPLTAKYGSKIAYVFVHFPLATHRFAQPAAVAAECAGADGRFEPMLDALYAMQDSFGLAPWSAYAKRAGVRDTAAFQRCIADTTSLRRVSIGSAEGRRIGLEGTPTVILNGWRYGTPPSDTELTRAITDILAGRKPYSGFKSEHH